MIPKHVPCTKLPVYFFFFKGVAYTQYSTKVNLKWKEHKKGE